MNNISFILGKPYPFTNGAYGVGQIYVTYNNGLYLQTGVTNSSLYPDADSGWTLVSNDVSPDNISLFLNGDGNLAIKDINLTVASTDNTIIQNGASTYNAATNTLNVNLSAASQVAQGGFLSSTNKSASSGVISPNTQWQSVFNNVNIVATNLTASGQGVTLLASKIYNIDFEGTILATGLVSNAVDYYFNLISTGATPAALFPQNFIVNVNPQNYESPIQVPAFSIQIPALSEDTTVFLGYKTNQSGGQYPSVALQGMTFRIAEVTADSGGSGGGIETFNGSANPNPTIATGTNVVAETDVITGVTTLNVNELLAENVFIVDPTPASNAITANLYLYYGGGDPNAIPYYSYSVPSIAQADINVLFGFVLYDVASGHSVPYPYYNDYIAAFPAIPKLWLSIGGLNSSPQHTFPWNSQTAAAFAADMIAYIDQFPNIVGIDFDVEGTETNNPNVLTWVPQAAALIKASKPNCKFGLVLTDQLSAGGGLYYGFYPNQKTLIANLVNAVGLNSVAMISKMTFDWGNAPIAETQCNTNDQECRNSCVQGSIDAGIDDLMTVLSVSREVATSKICAIFMVGKQDGQPANGVDDTGNLITTPWLEQQIANFQNQRMPNYGYWCINADQLASFLYLNTIYAGISGDVPPSLVTLQDWTDNLSAKQVAYVNPSMPDINTVQKGLDLALQASSVPDEELIINSASQSFNITISGIDTDISFQENIAPASIFNLTLNIADYAGSEANVTQKIFVRNNTNFSINQFAITLIGEIETTIYNTAVNYANFGSGSALTCYLTWTGNIDPSTGNHVVIADWSNGAVSQVNGISNVISLDGVIASTITGVGAIDSYISGDGVISGVVEGSGAITQVISSDNVINENIIQGV